MLTFNTVYLQQLPRFEAKKRLEGRKRLSDTRKKKLNGGKKKKNQEK